MTSGLSSFCASCGCEETSCANCKAVNSCYTCDSCCCSVSHQFWRKSRIITGVKVEYLSSAWMAVEAAGSLAIGLMAGSLALLAFGGDSIVELVSGIVVLSHLRKDPDSTRAGNRRTALVTNGLLFTIIPVIGLGAVYSYFAGLRPEGSPLAILIAVGAVIIMPFLWFEKREIGRGTRCLPLSIDAVESATCFFMSLTLLAGLLLEYFARLWWADYLATIVILAFVAREAVESRREVSGEEMPRN